MDKVLEMYGANHPANSADRFSRQTKAYQQDMTALLSDLWTTLLTHGITPPPVLNPLQGDPAIVTIKNAIMDESLLPAEPLALVEGVIEERSKVLISGAPKTWKSFLMISLGIAIATGTKWLGLQCQQAPIAYVNLEIGEAKFARRVYDMAIASGADKKLLEQNFKIIETKGFITLEQLMNKLVQDDAIKSCELIIIDPLYKIFDGSENNQEDMAAFFAQIDKTIESLGCTVVIVHHHSKGFQAGKDIVDRACGSNVLGRDPDTVISIERIEDTSNAMRAEFSLRGFEEMEPINYWFKYPEIIVDTSGALSERRKIQAHHSSRKVSAEKQLAKIEAICEELIEGRARFDRKELTRETKSRPETLNKYLDMSTRFMRISEANKCWVYRRDPATPPL